MHYKIKNLILLLVIVIVASCGDSYVKKIIESQTKSDSIVSSTIAKKDTIKIVSPKIDSTIIVNPFYDDLAAYISGVEPLKMDSSLLKKSAWKNYAQNIDKNWKKSDSIKIQKIKKWRNEELQEINEKVNTVFYPFSGADFLNSYAFFPTAKNHILIGLEPVGTLPDINKDTHNDSLAKYFYKINKALYSVLNFSFFITKDMKVDFKNEDLNGTIHLILIFIKRSGNSIVNVKPMALNENGVVVSYSSIEESKKDTLSNKGIEIDYVDKDSVLKKVYYFSVNLADQLFDKNDSFKSFVSNQEGEMITYIKSASYLMHKSHFSAVRNLIIDKSNYVLEDDSGIPLKFFDAKTWQPFLYGTYSGTIPMFSGFYQKDLKAAYDSLSHKSLDFGIGYKHKMGQSNLLLFKKNKG